jgi:hypothetical protein
MDAILLIIGIVYGVNLPIKIKNISNKPAFKSAVKNYLKITARNRELDDFSTIRYD